MAGAEKKIDDALLVRLYCEQPLFVDRLPYTSEFDTMIVNYNAKHLNNPMTHQEVWRRLVNLRKRSKLVRKSDNTVKEQLTKDLFKI